MGRSAAGDRFGASLTLMHDFDDDCRSLVVGAPGVDGSGALFVLQGSPSGFTRPYAVKLSRPRAGDGFGSSVSTFGDQVWAGAPGRDVAGQADAGAVGRFTAGADGPSELREFTQNSAGVGGTAERGDRFGEVLSQPDVKDNGNDMEAPTWSTFVVIVGVPHEDVGAAVDAGMAQELMDDPSQTSGGEVWTQNSEGVPGRAEAGDFFGAAVSNERESVAIGAPGEAVGSKKAAGSVTFLISGMSAWYDPLYAVTQDSPRVPGRAEPGDRFGATITKVDTFCGQTAQDGIAIGAPGEDIGSRVDTGGVVLFDTGIFFDEGYFVQPVCPSVWIQQGARAPGNLEPGDRFGTQVATTGSGDLAVSAPGEDRAGNSLEDTGVVDFVELPRVKPLREQTPVSGARANLRYGQLLTG